MIEKHGETWQVDLRTDLPTYALEAKLLRPTGKAKSVSSKFEICQRADDIIPVHYPLDSMQLFMANSDLIQN